MEKMLSPMTQHSFPETITAEIEKLVYGGDGLARTEYGAMLVPYTAPGEHIRVSSIQKKRGILYGKLQDIIRPSEYRILPFCPYFERGCGGCQWQHIEYPEQVEIKRRIIEESMERIGKETLPFPPLIHDPAFLGTRLRSVFHLNHTSSETGFYRLNTHEVVPIRECPLCASPLNVVLSFLHENSHLIEFVESARMVTNGKDVHVHLEGRVHKEKKFLCEIYELLNQYSEIRIGLSCSTKKGKFFSIGHQHIEFSVDRFRYLVHGRSFFQGHSRLNEKLIEVIGDLRSCSKKGDLLLDLFCGVGFFSVPFSSFFNRVIGIDNQRESIQLARGNARLNTVTNVEFYEKDLGGKDISFDVDSADTVIFDPPRRGCSKWLIEAVLRLCPSQIIMVSCNPTTMARDVRMILNHGYEIRSCSGIDLFPQTFHVETVIDFVKTII